MKFLLAAAAATAARESFILDNVRARDESLQDCIFTKIYYMQILLLQLTVIIPRNFNFIPRRVYAR